MIVPGRDPVPVLVPRCIVNPPGVESLVQLLSYGRVVNVGLRVGNVVKVRDQTCYPSWSDMY